MPNPIDATRETTRVSGDSFPGTFLPKNVSFACGGVTAAQLGSWHPRRSGRVRAYVRLGDLPEPQLGYLGSGVPGKRLVPGILKAASGPLPIPNSGTHPSAPALPLSWGRGLLATETPMRPGAVVADRDQVELANHARGS